MLEKAAILMVAGILGAGAAVGLAACGEDREGDVQFETTGTGTAAGTGTETAPSTETETAPETGTETAPPETESETETETTP
ncbi:MAG: hypothetical protein ACRDL4_04845 [Thermoleophilaceae bacterium]